MIARQVDKDFIQDHLRLFDRVQLPGASWTPADVYYKSGDIFFEAHTEKGMHVLPLGSQLQASGIGIVKYVSVTR